MQITTFSLFSFTGLRARYWAFTQMGLGPRRLRGVPGLLFARLLGCGRGNGFSVLPDWGRYALFAVWESEAAADAFFATHPLMAGYHARAASVRTHSLRATMFHGSWDGFSGFQAAAGFDPAAPVAVLTRAAIRPTHLYDFWKRVPRVSADVEGRPGLEFAVGVGEVPLAALATFSLWRTGREMMDYAYRRELHAGVVQRTRETGWYSEELFARFVVISN